MFISKSFKELFFKRLRFESGCKGKEFFLNYQNFFEVFSKSFFEVEVRVSVPLFSISICTASLSIAGAKVELFHIPTKSAKHFFCNLSANFRVTRWLSKDAVEHNFIALVLLHGILYLIIHTRAWEAKKLDKLASKIWFII